MDVVTVIKFVLLFDLPPSYQLDNTGTSTTASLIPRPPPFLFRRDLGTRLHVCSKLASQPWTVSNKIEQGGPQHYLIDGVQSVS